MCLRRKHVEEEERSESNCKIDNAQKQADDSIQHFPDAFKARTKPFGDPIFEKKERDFDGHQDQGYFSNKTEVADDEMFGRPPSPTKA